MQPLFRTVTTVTICVCLVATSFLLVEVKNVLADDFTFGTENVVKGYSVDPTNRNAEDAAYNTLIEGDQYTDTNYSGSSENVVTGTAGGGAFSSSLDTDDATRRSYTEADNAPADDSTTLVPTSDVSVGFDTVYPADGVHYTKVDEGASHDSATTYIRAVTNADKDIFGMGDMSEPSGTPDLDVTLYVISQDTGTGNAYYDAGVVISSTDYVGINDQLAPNTWGSANYFWEANPAGGEWTYTVINAMNIFIEVYDAAPDVDVTSAYIVVSIDYSANYVLDAQITYSSVLSTAQTISYNVICQGYRSGAENFGVYAWDYTGLSWTLKTTVQAASDTDYNFALLSTERDGAANEVKLRIVGLTETSDTTQDIVYFDLLKVNRLEKGYALEVELTSTTVAAHGDIELRLKGYTSAEHFQVDVWNYTSSAYDTAKMEIDDLSNTWQADVDLCDDHHRSGTSSKVKITDMTAATSDTTQDTLYLDVLWVSRTFTDPVISAYTAFNIEITEGEDVDVWATYSDYDDQAPAYMRAHWTGSYGAMSANDSDSTYYDGKLYGYTIVGLAEGVYYYWFATDDAESSEVTTSESSYTITVNAVANAAPEFTSSPTATGHNNTLYYYDANADDEDEDPLTFDLEGNITGWATINPTTGVVQGTPTAIGDYWMNISVTDGTATVWQNTSVHIYTDSPSFVTSAISTWQNGTTYLYNAQASDHEAEGLTFYLEGNGSSFVSITPAGYYCELEGEITEMGWWYLNLSVTDGTNTVWQNWTLTALNSAPYFTFEAVLTGVVNESYVCGVSGADNNSDALIYSIDASNINTKAWLTLNLSSMQLEGVPLVNGSYDVNLSVTDGLVTSWYNFSIDVNLNDEDTFALLQLVLAIVFCFGFLLAGFKEKVFWIAGGITWVICGIAVFGEFGEVFSLMGMAVGVVLLFMGAYDVWKR